MRTYLQNDQGQFDSIRTTVKTRLSTSTEQKKVFDKPTFKSFQTTTMERKRENWKPNFKAFQTTTTQDSPSMERKNKNWSPTFKASQGTIPQDSSIPSSTESSPTPEKTRTCTKQVTVSRFCKSLSLVMAISSKKQRFSAWQESSVVFRLHAGT